MELLAGDFIGEAAGGAGAFDIVCIGEPGETIPEVNDVPIT